MPVTPGMDYGSLLQLAQKTSEMKKAQRSASSLPPVHSSKESKNTEEEKKKLLNANVARFLAKREEEERKKKVKADEKRDGLLALRNQDSKARKRVKIMNKSAKSADRSVINDAGGSSDYYVIEEPLCFMSQESLVQEEKFLEKLRKIPQEEIFTKKKVNVNNDLSSTKDRVKMALLLGDAIEKKEKREAKEKLKEHGLKEKGRSASMKLEEPVEEEPKEEERPKKRHQARPPPLNYLELLKLAEKLQQEPVQEEPKEKEPELRPMSAKEKELFLLEEASRKRKEEGWKARSNKSDRAPISLPLKSSKSNLSGKDDNRSIPSIPRIPKISDSRPTMERKSDSYEERKSDSYEERKHKSNREERYLFSKQKSFHQTEEKASTSKPSSRQVENTVAARHRTVPDKNVSERLQKEDFRNNSGEERNSQSVKVHGTNRDRGQISSSQPSSRTMEKLSPVSRDIKDSKPRPVGTKMTPSFIAGKLHAQKILDNSRNTQLADRPKSQSSPTPNVKPREQKPHAHVLPKKLPPSDIKARSSHSYSPKQSDITSKTPGSKHQSQFIQPRQPSSSDSKAKQQNLSGTKSSSLASSSSKVNRSESQIKSKESTSNLKPKQSSSDMKGQQDLTLSKSKLSSVSVTVGKPRNVPPSDGKPRNLPPSDNKPRNFSPSDSKSRNFSPLDNKPRNLPPSDNKPRNFSPSNSKSRNFSPSESKPRNLLPSDSKPRNFPPSDVKTKSLPPSNGQPRKCSPNIGPKQFPPPDVRRKQFPPTDLKRKQFPPGDVRRGPKPPMAKKRRVIDSDDEYDSEVADFIDDGEDDGEDYSKHIRDIFGYDRSKYQLMDDDDECMESSFSQQMKEEFKSTKLGILEDLEDIRREKQREAMLKKKKKMS